MAEVVDRIDALLERLERLDARRRESPGQLGLDLTGGSKGPGGGEPCGNSWISPDKECHKNGGTAAAEKPASRFMQLAKATQERKTREAAERQQQQAAAAAMASSSPKLDLPAQADDKTAPLLDGRRPQKGLGGGAYGDTYLYLLKDGRQVVVKVDRLENLDPMETGYGKDQEAQRWDMVHREQAAMAKAHELGLAPRPIGDVQKLPDGRLAFAYEFVDGVKLWKDHREARLTPEAFALLERPGVRAKVASEVGRIARAMADSGFEHGDAHGGNVILGKDGSVTLIDWGYSNQSDSSTPRAKAGIEMRTVSILGEQLGVTGPIDMRAGRGGVKDRLSSSILHFQTLISDAHRSGDRVIRDYERDWDARPENTLEDAGKALLQANRLVKERGISFREAEGIVGLEAPLTPAIKAKAEAASNAVFGDRQLRLVRRMLDAHYRAWKDYAPAGAA
jgi:hypothetical protein